ncbi:3-oxoacyl-[acyl-carrier-protein] synthase 1 [compost metagenome]
MHEAIYSLLMMRDGFLAGSANIGILDRAAAAYPILLRSIAHRVATVMSNSFGFGGNNASLVFAAA